MMGYAQLLRDNDVDTELIKNEYLNNIISGGEKIKTIIDGLLMLAKIRNQQNIELMEIEMNSIIRSVMIRLHDAIRKSKAIVHLPDIWEKPLGNAIWVEEVWINLVTNAIKYGGNTPVIELGSEKKGNYIRFWVKDNGNGLTKEDQVRIFEEFSRLHPSKDSIKGHGLGLSIVQRIIKKMGGEVEVASVVGGGSTFSFTLPAS
jgi:signal transduction histidine kinase